MSAANDERVADLAAALVLHFPYIAPSGLSELSGFFVSCACEQFDYRGSWSGCAIGWATHVAQAVLPPPAPAANERPRCAGYVDGSACRRRAKWLNAALRPTCGHHETAGSRTAEWDATWGCFITLTAVRLSGIDAPPAPFRESESNTQETPEAELAAVEREAMAGGADD